MDGGDHISISAENIGAIADTCDAGQSRGVVQRKHLGAFNELRAVCWLMELGYEVFRNVSAHGAIDIVAIKGDETLRLDVKSSDSASANLGRVTQEHLDLGVRFLAAKSDGGFIIAPLPEAKRVKKCKRCGKPFKPKRGSPQFCSDECRHAAYRSQRRYGRQGDARE